MDQAVTLSRQQRAVHAVAFHHATVQADFSVFSVFLQGRCRCCSSSTCVLIEDLNVHYSDYSSASP